MKGNPRNYMVLESGEIVDILRPKPEQITLHDVAIGLSREKRYRRMTRRALTVAQHSVHVAQLGEARNPSPDEDVVRHQLLHDASEAYLGDVISPVKRVLPDYKRLEAVWMKCILKRFGLALRNFHANVSREDHDVYCAEVWYLIDPSLSAKYGFPSAKKHAEKIKELTDLRPELKEINTPWGEQKSYDAFMAMAKKYDIK